MNEAEGDKTTDKRKQHCTACRNHDRKQRKTSHKCPFDDCDCLLCQLTQTSRLIMRHQQRLWRHLKDKNSGNERHCGKKQVCDKCRNHGATISKRNHKGSCPHESCTCELCGLTSNRRDIMRHQQRVRRSATVTSSEQEDAYEYVQKTKMEIQKKFGDIGLDGTAEGDGYSSLEEKDDTPSSPEENLSSVQEGTKKQFIERYRRDEIATGIPIDDEEKPQHELGSPLPEASNTSLSHVAQHDQLQGESSNQFQQVEGLQRKLEDKTQQLNMCQHHLQALEAKMKRETSEKCELMGRVGQVVEEKGHLEDKMRTLERSVAANKVQIEQLQNQNQKVTDEKDQYMNEVSSLNEKEHKLQETLREAQMQLSQSNETAKKLSEELLKTKNELQQAVAQLEFWTSTATTDKNEKDSLAIKYSTLTEELLLRNKELEYLRKDKGELEERLTSLVVDLTSVREEAAINKEKLSEFEDKLSISEQRQKVVDQDNNCLKEKIKELSAQIEQLKGHQANSECGREAAERIAGDLSARLQTAKAEYHNLALLNLKLTKKIKRIRKNSDNRKDSVMEDSVASSQQSGWLQVAADDEDAEEDEEKLLNEQVEGAAAMHIQGMSQSCYSGFTCGTGCSSCSQSTKELTESVNRKMEDIVKGLSQQIESLKIQLLVAKATGTIGDTIAAAEVREVEALPQQQIASETCKPLEDQQREVSQQDNISNQGSVDAEERLEGATGGCEQQQQQQVLYSKTFLPAQQTAPVFLPEMTNSNNSLQAEAHSSSGCTLPSAPSPTPSMRSGNNEGISRSASAASAVAAAAAAAAAAASGLPSAPPYVQQGLAADTAQPQNLDTSGMDLDGLHQPLLPETTHTARQAAVMSQFVMPSQGAVGGSTSGPVHDSDDEDFHSTSGAEEAQLQPEAQEYVNGYVPHQNLQDHLIQCPMCSLSFQPGAMRLLEEHINSHLEHVCPICSQAFQRNNQAKFEEHVHAHFEDSESDQHSDTTGPWSILNRAHLLEID